MEIPANVVVFDTTEQLALAAAERFVACTQQAIVDRGVGAVALAGGKTPQRVYELLATEHFKSRVQWSRVHLFFGDERAVPPDHPDSNYAMVKESLISRVPVPVENIHRIIGEGDANENALLYENQLKTFFSGATWPRFDLVLLGMGADGHTASLFPHSSTLRETSKWVVATKAERSGHKRLTLTLPLINHSALVMFLVTGAEKAKTLAEVLHSEPGSYLLPAQAIQPVAGKLEWLLDTTAASLL